MITKYRNLGILYLVLALTTSVFVGVAFWKSGGLRDEGREYLLPLYLGAAGLWTLSSYTLAKAKGYHADALWRVLMISLLLGFCCQPASLVFPFLGFFLEDKTRPRRRSRRRRHHSRHESET